MRFEAVLGIWAFVIVCTAIAIVAFTLKMRYEREQKKAQSAGATSDAGKNKQG
jgi:hypothetical protein